MSGGDNRNALLVLRGRVRKWDSLGCSKNGMCPAVRTYVRTSSGFPGLRGILSLDFAQNQGIGSFWTLVPFPTLIFQENSQNSPNHDFWQNLLTKIEKNHKKSAKIAA